MREEGKKREREREREVGKLVLRETREREVEREVRREERKRGGGVREGGRPEEIR